LSQPTLELISLVQDGLLEVAVVVQVSKEPLAQVAQAVKVVEVLGFKHQQSQPQPL
jgi:hypothetical protein